MSYSPQATQSPRLNEVNLGGTTIENDFPYRSPKLSHNNNNNNNNNNNPSPIANYPPAYFHPSGSSNESSRGSSTSFPGSNSVGAVVEEVYPAESYAMPQSRGSSSSGVNSLPEGTSIIEGAVAAGTGGEGGIYQSQSQQRPPQSQEEWDESQQRMNLPQQYDYTRRASEASYPYDRNTTNGPSPISSNSPIPPRPGSADGYFYVAPTTTIASHLAIPPERDAPLYYNYGGYSSQPTYNHPNFAASAYSASGSTPTSVNSELPLLATPNIDSTGTFKSNSTRTSPAGGPAAPLYEKEGPNTDERNFKCDQCPHAFHRNHDLKRHKRIHLEIKPYPCHWCSKRFTRKDALKRHLLVKQHPAAPNVDGELPPPPSTSTKKTTKKMSKAAAAAAAAANLGSSSRRSSAGESSHQSMTDEIDDDQDFQPKREIFEGGISPQYLPPPNRSPTLPSTDLPSIDNSMNNLAGQPTRALSSRTRKSTGAPQYDYNETMDDDDEEEEDREFKERKQARERQQAKERDLEEEMEREEQQEQSRHQVYQQQQQHQQHQQQQQQLHHQQQLQAQQHHEHQQHQLYQQQLQQSHEQHYPQPSSHNSHNNNNSNNNDNSQLHQSQSHHEQHQQHQQQQYRAYYPL